jgi:hypothetical protein
MTGRTKFRVAILATIILLWSCGAPVAVTARDGDIVFQTSRSSQSLAIQAATHSPYSHMGMVLMRGDKPFVLRSRGGRIRWTSR